MVSFVKGAEQRLIKGGYMIKIRKLATLFILVIFIVNSFGVTYVSASESTSPSTTDITTSTSDSVIPTIDSETDGVFTLTFNRDENGNFSHDEMYFYAEDSQFSTSAANPIATIDFYLEPIITPSDDYYYTIMYEIKSTSLVNGTFGDLVVRNGNLLLPDIYFNQPIAFTFPSTLYYCGTAGACEILPGTPVAHVAYTNCFMYFNEYGWVSGTPFYVTTPVPIQF